jgi:hypothetical protein
MPGGNTKQFQRENALRFEHLAGEINMPQITISDETFAQLVAFLQASRAASEIDLTTEQAADYLIQIGIDQIVGVWLRSLDTELLVEDMLRLAREHPPEVYGHLAETMRRGAEEIARREKELSRQFGFGQGVKRPEAEELAGAENGRAENGTSYICDHA